MSTVSNPGAGRRVATLWHLERYDNRVSCAIYRDRAGLQLRLESADALILAEPFDLQPRMLARAEAVRASLRRRGWQDVSTPS